MDRKLIDYLPPVLASIREMQAIMEIEQPEAEMLWDKLSGVMDDQFVETASEERIKRWEKMMLAAPKESETLDERRFRILTKLAEETPYTWNRLMQALTSLCGEEGLTAFLDGYTLTVRVPLPSKHNFDAVQAMLNRMVPANIVIDLSLAYNQHQLLQKFTHAQLAEMIHSEIRNEVIA